VVRGEATLLLADPETGENAVLSLAADDAKTVCVPAAASPTCIASRRLHDPGLCRSTLRSGGYGAVPVLRQNLPRPFQSHTNHLRGRSASFRLLGDFLYLVLSGSC
jgi:hypothetical protein